MTILPTEQPISYVRSLSGARTSVSSAELVGVG